MYNWIIVNVANHGQYTGSFPYERTAKTLAIGNALEYKTEQLLGYKKWGNMSESVEHITFSLEGLELCVQRKDFMILFPSFVTMPASVK